MFEAKFQTFADPAESGPRGPRLDALRARLAGQNLDGFLAPRADEHQNEYVAKCDERLAWLTGFSGSAGFAVILKDEAAIFVDGRYVLQVRDEIDPKLFTPLDIGETPPSRWLAESR